MQISDKLQIKKLDKPKSPKFFDFESYKNLMLQTLASLVNNGKDAARKFKYGLVTTISRGYDAAATSALVKQVGCNKAITFSSPQKYVPDSGVEIAKLLGYETIIEGDGNEYLNNNKLYEAEASAGGDVGGLVSFCSFEKHYSNSILFMGLKGDCIWGKNEPNPNNEYDYGHMSIAAEQNPEHYLNCNTIAISVPTLLADQWEMIAKISNSEEMKSYSIGGTYDRPIPRKILESNGVPRRAFGFKKMGAGFTFRFNPSVKSVKAKMSQSSYESFIDFCKNRRAGNGPEIAANINYYKTNYPYYIAYLLRRMHIPYHPNVEKYVSSPTSEKLIQWGLWNMKKRYHKCLKHI